MTPAAEIEQLWNEHHVTLFNFIKRHTREEAEDVVQDVYLSALEAMGRGYGYHEHAKGWLYRIARNRVIDGYRKRTPQLHDIDEMVDRESDTQGRARAEVLVCDQHLPETIAEQHELAEMVERALDRLTADQETVVRLRLAGLSHDEIAETTGKDVRACKSLQGRAFGKLHVVLAKRLGYSNTSRDVPRSNCAEQVRALLLENGPMMATQIEHALRLGKGPVAYALRFSGLFRVVQKLPAQNRGLPRNVWGLVGIHEPKESEL